MRNFKGILFISLFIIPALVGVLDKRNEVANAQVRPQQQPLWGELFGRRRPPIDQRSGGKRGDFCIITPWDIQGKVGLWNNRPLFVWQGQLSRIEVYPAGKRKMLWRQNVQATDISAQYTGEALQPGQSYDWMLFDSTSNESSAPTDRITFRMMNEAERQRITADLAALESQLKSKGATEEEIAYERANYFIEKQLWADALQQVYGVKNPAAELTQLRESLSEQLCKPSKPEQPS